MVTYANTFYFKCTYTKNNCIIGEITPGGIIPCWWTISKFNFIVLLNLTGGDIWSSFALDEGKIHFITLKFFFFSRSDSFFVFGDRLTALTRLSILSIVTSKAYFYFSFQDLVTTADLTEWFFDISDMVMGHPYLQHQVLLQENFRLRLRLDR